MIKPNTFSKSTACTLTGPLGELMSSLQNPRGKEANYLLLSHLPPAATRAAHPQHKHLDRGCCTGVCLCHCTSTGCWVKGYPGCDQCPQKQGKGDTETHPAILRSLPTASQFPKALGAEGGCSCPKDTVYNKLELSLLNFPSPPQNF